MPNSMGDANADCGGDKEVTVNHNNGGGIRSGDQGGHGSNSEWKLPVGAKCEKEYNHKGSSSEAVSANLELRLGPPEVGGSRRRKRNKVSGYADMAHLKAVMDRAENELKLERKSLDSQLRAHAIEGEKHASTGEFKRKRMFEGQEEHGSTEEFKRQPWDHVDIHKLPSGVKEMVRLETVDPKPSASLSSKMCVPPRSPASSFNLQGHASTFNLQRPASSFNVRPMISASRLNFPLPNPARPFNFTPPNPACSFNFRPPIPASSPIFPFAGMKGEPRVGYGQYSGHMGPNEVRINVAALGAKSSIANQIGSSAKPRPAPQQSGAQAVGWPPIRAKRIRVLQPKLAPADLNAAPTEPMFVKVNVHGAPIGRKIDLKAYNSYNNLIVALDDMFKNSMLAQNPSSSSANPPSLSRRDYTLVYEDYEGDNLVAGDIPWEMFATTVKRLRIVRSSDARHTGSSGKAKEGTFDGASF